MKTITLWQPWATFVAIDWKTIEARTHQRFKGLVGQRIAIHAARKIDRLSEWVEHVPPGRKVLDGFNLDTLIDMSCGTIVCTATVTAARWAPNVDFVEREEWNSKSLCEVAGKFCLFLEDVKPLKIRIPFRGRQGVFNVPDELIKDYLTQSTQPPACRAYAPEGARREYKGDK